jgi:hypothetical protein
LYEKRRKGPVIAGVLDTGFHDALQAGKEFAGAGVDGLLVLTPYYTNPTQLGIRDYFLRYADASPVPILIYEIPYRTRVAINPAILHELSRHERIIGMKACNTDMYHFLQVVAGVHKDFAVLSGEDSLFPLHLAAGARGGIIVTANLLPKAWRAIYEAGDRRPHRGGARAAPPPDSADEHGLCGNQPRADEGRIGHNRRPRASRPCASSPAGASIVQQSAQRTCPATRQLGAVAAKISGSHIASAALQVARRFAETWEVRCGSVGEMRARRELVRFLTLNRK